MSLIISHAQQINGTKFHELASINGFDGNHVSQLSNTTATATGHMGLFHDPYLALEWTNPSAHESGFYQCTANGMDEVGHLAKASKSVQVTSASGPGTAANNSATNSDLQIKIDELTNRVLSLEKTKLRLFNISEEFNGSKYYLSSQFWKNVDVAEALCQVYGGYLAEINNAAEYGFIKNFLNPFLGVDRVLVGASDELTEGQWYYRYSKHTVMFTNWNTGEPNTDSNDCMILYGFNDWKMQDFPCYDDDQELQRYFLCEISK